MSSKLATFAPKYSAFPFVTVESVTTSIPSNPPASFRDPPVMGSRESRVSMARPVARTRVTT
jgi:hypothetical protein